MSHLHIRAAIRRAIIQCIEDPSFRPPAFPRVDIEDWDAILTNTSARGAMAVRGEEVLKFCLFLLLSDALESESSAFLIYTLRRRPTGWRRLSRHFWQRAGKDTAVIMEWLAKILGPLINAAKDACKKEPPTPTILKRPLVKSLPPSPLHPSKDSRIYHMDSDPLSQQIPVSFFPAHGRWRAESFTALMQLVDHIKADDRPIVTLQDPAYASRRDARAKVHQARLAEIASRPRLGEEEALDGNNIGSLLKRSCTTSCSPAGQGAGSTAARRASGARWSNDAVLGIQMALADLEKENAGGGSRPGLVCQVVGDGSFMCAAPSSALWVASKYKIPILTIVLNNGGWKAPRNSAQLVYPAGLAASATDEEINISFRPTSNYAALAEAAAGSEVGWADAGDNGEA
ncbi:hypothetical protein K438DRAFT_1763390 [Mycena galopus ATCC 62051]|nr:hypothetical protein K438DRAFT_1763390 [Mycena galopus ATCC 62051]